MKGLGRVLNKKVFLSLSTLSLIATPIAVTTSFPVQAYASSFPIHTLVTYGNRGSAVKVVQSSLNKLGFHAGGVDGIYGAITHGAIIRFQRAHHLTQDGVVGPHTWNALQNAINHLGPTPAKTPVTRVTTSSPSSPSATSLPVRSVVRYGSRGSAVKVVQSALNSLGFHAGGVDGIYGPETSRALRAFQRAHHLVQDGVVGPHTWGAFKSALSGKRTSKSSSSSSSSSKSTKPATTKSSPSSSTPYPGRLVRYGSRGTEVKEVQRQLNKLGFNSGTVDGIYGPVTYRAIRRFQGAHHLGTDGIVGPKTWPILFPKPKAAAKPAPSVTYTAYKGDKKTVIGHYKTEADAQKAAAKVPGGIVKNASGKVVYQSPDYIAEELNGHVLGSYLTESAAKNKIGNTPGDKVVDGNNGNKVVVQNTYYSAVKKDGTKIGDYTSLSTAKSKVSNQPGGKVLDETDGNKVVYTEPDYGVFSTPVNKIGEYTSESTADAHKSWSDYVVNLNTKKVVKMPGNYYYLSNGNWYSHAYGWQGTQVPSFAKSGDRYIVTNATPGQSPYETKYYLLDNANGDYLGSSQSWTWQNSFRTKNLKLPSTATGSQINSWLKQDYPSSALYGLGSSFVGAQNFYGANAIYLLSHAGIESAFGDSSIALDKNNLFGFGAYDSNPANDAGVFPTDNYSIYYQSWFVRNVYLNPNSPLYHEEPTLDGMNQYYATSRNWASAVATVINEYTSQNQTKFASSSNVIEPKSTVEPIYFTNGFEGKLTNVPNYPGKLVNGDYNNSNVRLVQNALDANGENISIDGDFGPNTQKAVTNYQTKAGLSPTGTVDQNTWDSLFPTWSGQFNVDEMMIGRMDSKVIELYHVSQTPSGKKVDLWIDAPFVTLTNVQRIEPSNGPKGPQAQIPVYMSNGSVLKDASGNPIYVHAGDYVVPGKSSNGYTAISFTNLTGSNAVKSTGYVKTTDVTFISYTAQAY